MAGYVKIENPTERKRWRRKRHIRKRVSGTAQRPRLSVFRSNAHIYVQAIDDATHRVLAAASDLEKELAGEAAGKKKSERARLVGKAIAQRLKDKNVVQVVFDRNGYIYHGRVKEVAEGAREGGLEF
ncbi:MAG TPA: 50S ribosomal protein L18 [Kofleriaceae bacterium]|nr:50S ribosomal protein L18 [Kofleriaceae bacterium]